MSHTIIMTHLDAAETGNYIQSNMTSIMTPIAPNPSQPMSSSTTTTTLTPTQLLPTQTLIRTTDGQMLIPIQTQTLQPQQQQTTIQVQQQNNKQTVQGTSGYDS